jgi:hypothetical protein
MAVMIFNVLAGCRDSQGLSRTYEAALGGAASGIALSSANRAK